MNRPSMRQLESLVAVAETGSFRRAATTLGISQPALSAQVHDLMSYPAESIAFGMRYSDAVSWDELGRTSADIRRVSMIEPDLPASRSTAADSEEPTA